MLFRSNDTATTEIYTLSDTLSLHDALPICDAGLVDVARADDCRRGTGGAVPPRTRVRRRASRLGNCIPIVGNLAPGSSDPAGPGTALGIPVASGFCLPIRDLPCCCAAVRKDCVAGRCTCAFVPSREID